MPSFFILCYIKINQYRRGCQIANYKLTILFSFLLSSFFIFGYFFPEIPPQFFLNTEVFLSKPWTLGTFLFQHSDYLHFALSLVFIFITSKSMEKMMGSKKFFIYNLFLIIYIIISTAILSLTGNEGDIFHGITPLFVSQISFIKFFSPSATFLKIKYNTLFWSVVIFLLILLSNPEFQMVAQIHLVGMVFGKIVAKWFQVELVENNQALIKIKK